MRNVKTDTHTITHSEKCLLTPTLTLLLSDLWKQQDSIKLRRKPFQRTRHAFGQTAIRWMQTPELCSCLTQPMDVDVFKQWRPSSTEHNSLFFCRNIFKLKDKVSKYNIGFLTFFLTFIWKRVFITISGVFWSLVFKWALKFLPLPHTHTHIKTHTHRSLKSPSCEPLCHIFGSTRQRGNFCTFPLGHFISSDSYFSRELVW